MFGSLFLLAALISATTGEPPADLLQNPGFEADLGGNWEKRTPDDAVRQSLRTAQQPHSGGWCLTLASRDGTAARVRQGSDRRLTIPPGSLVELSAWVRSELGEDGRAGVQLYCMDERNAILTQPRRDLTVDAHSGWRPVRLLVIVPDRTRYCMAYVQTAGAPGRVHFDDVQLRVVRPPRKREPLPKIGLLTDLDAKDACLRNLHSLWGDSLVQLSATPSSAALDACSGLVVVLRSASPSPDAMAAVTKYVGQGRPAFMDLRAFAAWQRLATLEVRLAPPSKAKPAASDLMQIGLTVAKTSPVTAGLECGQVIPYVGADGKLLLLAPLASDAAIDVLATAAKQPALVEIRLGKGRIAAGDVLSLREPYYAHIDGYYKYLFLVNSLANPKRLALGEYYPRKLTYAEFVAEMRRVAQRLPAIRIVDEGRACGDARIYSLNLGRPGAPLYFLYAAAHGPEWEPGYGLLTFAKHLAAGRFRDVVDLDRVSVKIVPLLNPTGYDGRTRQNAHGVDLNRQGDQSWDRYQGRDSNGDGRYGPGDYDWKGDRPFCEPEAETYRRIVSAANLYCTLDFHGNSSATNNRVGFAPLTARDDCLLRALDLQEMVNQRLRGRFLLRQNDQAECEPYLLERVTLDSDRPTLHNTGARDRYGLLVELTAGYADSYGTLLQTEVTSEVCRALFQAFPPP